MTARSAIEWPAGTDFAFTVFDDTDNATLENVPPVYAFLEDLGLRTTKSVWPIRAPGTARIDGLTCEDAEYRAWTLDLQARGFEIGYHGASNVTAPRRLIVEALERFRGLYGHDPGSMANHSDCAESIYWGADRVSGLNRTIYNVLTGFARVGRFRGHRADDPLFWGDLCRASVRYVRNFTFADVDTLAACPVMPYHDPARPYVGAWFAASEGADVRAFNARLSESDQDRLEAVGGACIMYTHFAEGFWDDGPDRRFGQLMERLSRKNGWFVPVTTLLDHIAASRGVTVITNRQRDRLERRWLLSKIRVGHT
jgi:hypothetical protein